MIVYVRLPARSSVAAGFAAQVLTWNGQAPTSVFSSVGDVRLTSTTTLGLWTTGEARVVADGLDPGALVYLVLNRQQARVLRSFLGWIVAGATPRPNPLPTAPQVAFVNDAAARVQAAIDRADAAVHAGPPR